MGRITFANVVSDLYSLGVYQLDSLSLMLSPPEDMSEEERKVAFPLILQGFQESASIAKVRLLPGVFVENPWLIIGGIASSVCTRNEFIMPDGAEVGDVLVLTKAIGTQVAALVHQHLTADNEQAKKLLAKFSRDELDAAIVQSQQSMARLNRTGSILMHKYEAHGCTDVTGFGILGHADNLAQCQLKNVDFILDTLPIIKYMKEAAELLNHGRLMKGTSAETSGGLLITISETNARAFIEEIEKIDNEPAWIVGRVVAGSKKGRLAENVEFIDYVKTF